MRLILPLHILAFTPWWILAPLAFMLTIGIVWILRDAQEGVAYNVARSSQFGDVALFTVIFMAVAMLQDGRSVPPALNLWVIQFCLLLIAAAVGYIWIKIDPTHRWGDRYHHMVVAPMLVYLGINAGVIILYAGALWEILLAVALLWVWLGLVSWDVHTGRLDQRKYLAGQGITGLKD